MLRRCGDPIQHFRVGTYILLEQRIANHRSRIDTTQRQKRTTIFWIKLSWIERMEQWKNLPSHGVATKIH